MKKFFLIFVLPSSAVYLQAMQDVNEVIKKMTKIHNLSDPESMNINSINNDLANTGNIHDICIEINPKCCKSEYTSLKQIFGLMAVGAIIGGAGALALEHNLPTLFAKLETLKK